jgi:MoaD family protein
MNVNVRILGELSSIFGRRKTITLEEGSTVNTLVNSLQEETSHGRQGHLGRYKIGEGELAVLLNGRNILLLEGVKTVLHDGDNVSFIPPAAGG